MEPFNNYQVPDEPHPDFFTTLEYCKKLEGADAYRTPCIKLRVSNPADLLDLCEQLGDISTRELEIKINTYLQNAADASDVFLINLLTASEEAVVQARNHHPLNPSIRLPLSEETITGLNEYRCSALPRHIEDVNEEIIRVVKKVLCKKELSQCSRCFLMPIYSGTRIKARQQFGDTQHSVRGAGAIDDAPAFVTKNIQNSFTPHSIHAPMCDIDSSEKEILPQDLNNVEDEPVLLVCIMNSGRFVENECELVRLVNETFRYCLPVLMNTAVAEEQARQKRQSQSLLLVARRLFSHLNDLNDLLKEIMAEARQLTNAERCSLFLLDPDHMHLVAKVFDSVGCSDKKSALSSSSTLGGNEVRIAKDQGIAGHVAATGKILNIKKAYDHPLFYKGMDEATGFKTRNILCFPICDEHAIIGVAQLCNKKGGGNFDYFDEQIANAFSIYCGLSIMHSLVYKEIQDAQARSKLSNELMMYHMKVNDADITRVMECTRDHDMPNFDRFDFSPRILLYSETPCFVLRMFEELGFVERFRIRKECFIRFLLFVKKGYRDPPYHNWTHAFSVTHFAFLCLKNFKLIENGYITELEGMAYIISCLCHDIDHRGTTNSFQEGSGSVLANLYSSEGSVMERHHLSQTLCTLNTQGCNFLESLNREDYILCLDLIKDMILATDLSTHFKIYCKQTALVNDGYDPSNCEHRYALICLLMTCADLSDHIKSWSVAKRVAQDIYAEFFAQGDLEKEMGKNPAAMMDRDKASIPDLQIEFLTNVCLPVFQVLACLFPRAKRLGKSIKRNILCWEVSRPTFKRMAQEGKSSFEILTSMELETEVDKLVKDMHVDPK